MNKVYLVGRTTRDIETRYSQSANPIAVGRVGIAVKKQKAKEGEAQADFFNLVFFGKLAEVMEKYAPKGTLIAVTGRLQVSTWEDAQKVKHTSCEIVVDEMELLGKAKGEVPGVEQPVGPIVPNEDEDDLPF